MIAHISGRWTKPTWTRLSRILDEFGDTYFEERFPNVVEVLRFGPEHRSASQVTALLAKLTSPEAADLWKPALARRLILRTNEHYARAGGPGLHPDSTEDERRAYFEWCDAVDQAERDQDLPTVRRLCDELVERLPEELRHLRVPGAPGQGGDVRATLPAWL